MVDRDTRCEPGVDLIVSAARRCIGTRFRHQGRQPGLGLDCAGLIAFVAGEVGMVVRDDVTYRRNPDSAHLIATMDASFRRLYTFDAGIGDIFGFWIRRDDEPKHLAIKVAPTRFVHVWDSIRCVVETVLDYRWLDRIWGAWAFEAPPPPARRQRAAR